MSVTTNLYFLRDCCNLAMKCAVFITLVSLISLFILLYICDSSNLQNYNVKNIGFIVKWICMSKSVEMYEKKCEISCFMYGL